MSEKPPSIKPPLTIPQPGDVITAAQSATLTRRLMTVEKEVWPRQPASWEPPRMAKITGTGGSAGFYEGAEVYWDGSAWQDQSGGVTYDSSNAGELYEMTGNDGVSIDDIVLVFLVETQDSGAVQWMFKYDKPPTPFFGKIDPANAAQVIIGAQRAAGTYQWLDTIYVQGTDLTLNKSAAETVVISQDSAVYYEIDVSASPITATLAAAATVPDDTDTLRYVVLGIAAWDAGNSQILRYAQQQLGNIIVNPEYFECDCVSELDDLTDVEVG